MPKSGACNILSTIISTYQAVVSSMDGSSTTSTAVPIADIPIGELDG
jgi:hypothetical protein